MEQPLLHDSTKYPPGYGDFALQCSNNVVCYFPRHLLEYMSPVFSDMFSLPTEASKSEPLEKGPQPLLKLTESSTVIEALLQHIDPKSKRALPIEPGIILELLEAARKYQVNTITKWFLGQVGLPQIDDSNDPPVFLEPFTVTHPQVVLTCALRFDFPHLGKLALRELAGCPSSMIQLESDDLPARVYKHQCQFREARTERYREYISQLSHLTKQFLKSHKLYCAGCAALIVEWFLCMERTIGDTPSWKSFFDAFHSLKACGHPRCGNKPLSGSLIQHWEEWEAEATELENELPEWPF